MPTITSKQATQRYMIEFTLTMGLYVVAVFGAPALIAATAARGPALYALALIPAVPIAAAFAVMGRYLLAADEYMRARAVKALLLAAAVVICTVTGWDFLQVYAGAPAIPPFFVGPGFFAAIGIAAPLCHVLDRPKPEHAA